MEKLQTVGISFEGGIGREEIRGSKKRGLRGAMTAICKTIQLKEGLRGES